MKTINLHILYMHHSKPRMSFDTRLSCFRMIVTLLTGYVIYVSYLELAKPHFLICELYK